MTIEHPYFVLAFYQFSSIENPEQEITLHKEFFSTRDIKSRIYISENGINGQMSGARQDADEYMNWMHSREQFKEIHFKIHEWHEQVFPRTIVKYRKQLVAIDESVDLSKTGEHLSPTRWKEMLENEKDYLLLDIRNDYEWKVGHFDGAELPPCATFRDFNLYAEKLKNEVKPDKKVMMYCTGGIRCELYSSILKDKGFDNVYQLNGGIINYGLEEGNKHWQGKLFVFDDRLAIPISEDKPTVVGECHRCQTPNDDYYNCANTDCNHLFLCCQDCLKELAGCCQESCKIAPRVRPYQDQNPHKPFRKKHHYKLTVTN